jgi:hypothetical protein
MAKPEFFMIVIDDGDAVLVPLGLFRDETTPPGGVLEDTSGLERVALFESRAAARGAIRRTRAYMKLWGEAAPASGKSMSWEQVCHHLRVVECGRA